MKTLAKIATATVLIGTLAACDSIGGGDYSESDAKAGAAFRHHARDVVAKLNVICPFSVEEAQLAQYDGVKKRFDGLRETISGRSFQTDLVSAEADYAYLMEVTELECAAPDGPGTAEKIAQEVARIDGQLGELEKIVGGL